MKELILHVGMHKTGTTSIQQSLQGYDVRPIRYLDLGSPNHSAAISAAFWDTPDDPPRPWKPVRPPERLHAVRQRTLRRLEGQLSRPAFRKFVISGEGIIRLPPPSLEALRDTLLQYVDRVHVFAYLRDPVGFSSSAFQQLVKAGMDGCELPRANYRDKFAPLIAVFGRENVTVRVFDKARLKDGSVVADFCDLWQIPFEASREVRRNESLSEAAVKFLHLFNGKGVRSTGAGLKQARMAMVEELRCYLPGRFDLPARFRGAAVDAEDVRWISREFGIELPVEAGPSGAAGAPEAFQAYLHAIDPAALDTYREALVRRGLEVTPADGALDLMNRHFNACLGELPELQSRGRLAMRAESDDMETAPE